MVSSQLEAFLESMASECDEKALRAIKANEIFYQVNNANRVTSLLSLLFHYLSSVWSVKTGKSCILFHCKKIQVHTMYLHTYLYLTPGHMRIR